MGDERKLSGVQKLLTGLFSPATAARMEANSRMWMMQCPNCSYEQSIWDIGGIRYKAFGNPRSLQRCPNCGKIGWHKIYRQEGSLPEVPVAGPDSKRPPRWLMWAALLGIVAAFFVVLFIVVTALLGSSYFVVTRELQRFLSPSSLLGTAS
jgi:ribosomal protein S27E